MRIDTRLTPGHIVRRAKARAFERRTPYCPLLARPAVEFLAQWLRPTDVVLEYGAGRSSRWFADRVASLDSVETDPVWYDRVQGLLAGSPNARIHLFDGQATKEGAAALGVSGLGAHTADPGLGPQVQREYVEFVARFDERSFDLVLNDGWARGAMGNRLLPLVKPGGLLVWDDETPEQLASIPTPEVRSFIDNTADWRSLGFDDGLHLTALYFAPVVRLR